MTPYSTVLHYLQLSTTTTLSTADAAFVVVRWWQQQLHVVIFKLTFKVHNLETGENADVCTNPIHIQTSSAN